MADIPFDRVIWDAQECADYLKITRKEFVSKIRHRADFPSELRIKRAVSLVKPQTR